MSLTQPRPESSRSPSFSLNLSSNNPFRNRAVSPPQLSPLEAPPRPVSRNPFLNPPGATLSTSPPMPLASGPPAVLTGHAAELFDNLALSDKPKTTRNGMRPAPPPPPYSSVAKTTTTAGGSRSENVPPRGPPTHRPTRSQEDAMRARRVGPGGGAPGRARAPTGELDIFADPESPIKSSERRPRRNSESSVLERGGKPLDPKDEKKRQEQRRRREQRHRDREAGKDPRKKDRKLDVIDQLDATSIYGTGLFHHDGPFDACNPHRNRAGSKRAPMQAFPKDSLNNVIGGGGPLHKRPDHATFLGNNDEEAFKDYATGGAGSAAFESYGSGSMRMSKLPQPIVESALQRVEPIHGDESLGLGTSTFLEGAPASRIAIQRRETESSIPDAAGLQRKKSLAQKIRGINHRRDLGPSGPLTSPGGLPGQPSQTSPDIPRPGSGRGANEKNPFFKEFDEAEEEKLDVKTDVPPGESITIVDPVKPGRPRAPSSPKRGLGERVERRLTIDGTDEEPSRLGFLSRVKSLKGVKKRPERPDKPAPVPA